jgi:hypothetical protein
MNTPGFTAEASLYKTAVEYNSSTQRRWTGNMGDSKGSIVPQMPLTCSSLYRCCRNGNESCCDVWIIYC